jgi:hypothetical protein
MNNAELKQQEQNTTVTKSYCCLSGSGTTAMLD